ncbi:sensor N-terminal transmembrane domain-containing protein [Halocynthiibacter sp.]|uniref:sensor N-terminal transmembrane domain-containing protein n=1 Tax=Halocynthiibacter sp. TaxID=1979210 RepID=UPI003C43A7D6
MKLLSFLKARNIAAPRQPDVVLGEDWVSLDGNIDAEVSHRRSQRGGISLNRSPLARKIITFNLLALIFLVAGVLFLNPFRDSLVFQREAGLQAEAELISDVFEVQVSSELRLRENQGQAFEIATVFDADLVNVTLAELYLPPGGEVFVFSAAGDLLASARGEMRRMRPSEFTTGDAGGATLITDFLNSVWDVISGVLAPGGVEDSSNARLRAQELIDQTLVSGAMSRTWRNDSEGTSFAVSTPVMVQGRVAGLLAVLSAAGEIDELVRQEREQVLQIFVIAILVSIVLSLVLASTMANPLSDLAAAAELGRDKNARKVNPGRIRIPDLTARPDEIGRLSGALRGMVAALYDRIDANEQFAADVAHEIKNPLASLRSAVGTLRVAKKDEHRERMHDVIEHDVRRLDRLVSDISNASRLDSELVKEDESAFDLLKLLVNLTDYLGNEAGDKGVEFISDLPSEPIVIQGLEARLAQVFVNLITNAISFCETGDAIRVWVRRRENRILVVVEDTGPGIPDGALQKIFNRFYSERPEGQFGNNSGLGLAISKQIVEAHGGVIWAENIRPTEADLMSEPLGARFVVGLPV